METQINSNYDGRDAAFAAEAEGRKFIWIKTNDQNASLRDDVVLDRSPNLVVGPSAIVVRDETSTVCFRVFGANRASRADITTCSDVVGADGRLGAYIGALGERRNVHEVLFAHRPRRPILEMDGGDAQLCISIVKKINEACRNDRDLNGAMNRVFASCTVLRSDGMRHVPAEKDKPAHDELKWSAHILLPFYCSNGIQAVAWTKRIIEMAALTPAESATLDQAYMRTSGIQSLRTVRSRKEDKLTDLKYRELVPWDCDSCAISPAALTLADCLVGYYVGAKYTTLSEIPAPDLGAEWLPERADKYAAGELTFDNKEQMDALVEWTKQNALNLGRRFGVACISLTRSAPGFCPLCKREHDSRGGYVIVMPFETRFCCLRAIDENVPNAKRGLSIWHIADNNSEFFDRTKDYSAIDYRTLEKDLTVADNMAAFRRYVRRNFAYIMPDGSYLMRVYDKMSQTVQIKECRNFETVRHSFKIAGATAPKIVTFDHAIGMMQDEISYETINDFPRGVSLAGCSQTVDAPHDHSVFNTWRGFSSRLVEGAPNLDLIAPFLEHLRNGWCGRRDDLFDFVTKWIAQIVQDPTGPHVVSLIVRGKQGTGKSLIGDIIGAMLGGRMENGTAPNNLYISTSMDALLDHFNASFEGRLLACIDEAGSSDATKRQQTNALKDIVTATTRRIEHKGKDAYIVRNNMRIMFMTNDAIPIFMDPNERRYVVLDTDPARAEDMKIMAPLVAMLHNQLALDTLFTYFAGINLNGWDPTKRPYTEGHDDMVLGNLNLAQRFILAASRNEVPTFSEDKFAAAANGELWVTNAVMFEAFRAWCVSIAEQHAISEAIFQRQISSILGATVQRGAGTMRIRGRAMKFGDFREGIGRATKGASERAESREPALGAAEEATPIVAAVVHRTIY